MSSSQKMSSGAKKIVVNVPATAGTQPATSRRRRRNRRRDGDSISALPAGVTLTTNNRPASISSVGGAADGRIRVTHREFLDQVTSKANFWCRAYSINPGLDTTFPWLYGMAQLYEKYMFRNLWVEYVPVVGTATPGRVAIAFDFDASDALPENLPMLTSYNKAISTSVYAPARLAAVPLDLRGSYPQRYVRGAGLGANSDIKTYDVAQLFVAAYGAGAPDTVVGELYLHYDVELYTPQRITTTDLLRSRTKRYIFNSPTLTPAHPFAGVPVDQGGSLPVEFDPSTYTFKLKHPGRYLAEIWLNGTTVSDTPEPAVTSGAASGTMAKYDTKVNTATRAAQNYIIDASVANEQNPFTWVWSMTGKADSVVDASVNLSPFVF